MTRVAVTDRLRAGIGLLLRPSGSLPPLSRRGQVFDALVAVGLAIVAIQAGGGDVADMRRVEVGPPDPGYAVPYPPEAPVRPDRLTETPFLPIEQNQAGWAIVMVLVVVPLMFRRRNPLAVLWTVLAMVPLVDNYHAALRLSFYACIIAAYSAAVYSPYRLPALASLPVAAFLYAQSQSSAVPTISGDSVPFLILLPIVVTADGLRRWKRRADEDRARLAALEIEQVEALRRATEHERARIARELHDVVTHNVSVMIIQAGAARKVMDATPDQAREALLAVEAGGRAAMAELRQVMGLLTIDSDGPDPAGSADLAPQPGLDRLAALVERVRDTGVPVELMSAGDPRPVPSGIELAAYRVVQEALTNTVRHATGAAATVVVEFEADHLRILVTDTGGTPGPASATGNGRGLIGLRERLAVYGGTLHTGPRLSGGYRVDAQIPLEPADS